MPRQRPHHRSMAKRATKRPTFDKPDHWDDAPAPAAKAAKGIEDDPEGLSPTRYGDWTRKGIAIDF
jgi:hypothetical protein